MLGLHSFTISCWTRLAATTVAATRPEELQSRFADVIVQDLAYWSTAYKRMSAGHSVHCAYKDVRQLTYCKISTFRTQERIARPLKKVNFDDMSCFEK